MEIGTVQGLYWEWHEDKGHYTAITPLGVAVAKPATNDDCAMATIHISTVTEFGGMECVDCLMEMISKTGTKFPFHK
jgi:hypothetical protein